VAEEKLAYREITSEFIARWKMFWNFMRRVHVWFRWSAFDEMATTGAPTTRPSSGESGKPSDLTMKLCGTAWLIYL